MPEDLTDDESVGEKYEKKKSNGLSVPLSSRDSLLPTPGEVFFRFRCSTCVPAFVVPCCDAARPFICSTDMTCSAGAILHLSSKKITETELQLRPRTAYSSGTRKLQCSPANFGNEELEVHGKPARWNKPSCVEAQKAG